jgi:hypothetical protein
VVPSDESVGVEERVPRPRAGRYRLRRSSKKSRGPDRVICPRPSRTSHLASGFVYFRAAVSKTVPRSGAAKPHRCAKNCARSRCLDRQQFPENEILSPIQATYHPSLQALYGSDGTRTRDLRRDRPVRWSRRLTTMDAESLYSCGFAARARSDSDASMLSRAASASRAGVGRSGGQVRVSRSDALPSWSCLPRAGARSRRWSRRGGGFAPARRRAAPS